MYKAASQAWRSTKGFIPQTIALFPGRKPVRDLMGLPASLGRIGSLEVRLATHKRDIRKAQKLRCAAQQHGPRARIKTWCVCMRSMYRTWPGQQLLKRPWRSASGMKRSASMRKCAWP